MIMKKPNILYLISTKVWMNNSVNERKKTRWMQRLSLYSNINKVKDIMKSTFEITRNVRSSRDTLVLRSTILTGCCIKSKNHSFKSWQVWTSLVPSATFDNSLQMWMVSLGLDALAISGQCSKMDAIHWRMPVLGGVN